MIGTVLILAAACTFSELPDPQCTPGEVVTQDAEVACNPADRGHRPDSSVTAHVRALYGMPRYTGGEVDHRVPHALGGAETERNLWMQPGPELGPFSFHEKDALETHVWREVCVNHTMSLPDAQAIFLAPDWRVPYCQIINGPACAGWDGDKQ